MDVLSRQEFRALFETRSQPCVSIFLPAHRAGPEIRQDRIRLKNLLREAEERLASNGLRAAKVRDLLSGPERLVDNEYFWRHQSDGLAVFVAQDFFKHYRLQLSFQELVVVAGHFHLKPLLPLFTEDGPYYVLALSQNQWRFFEGRHQSFDEIKVEGAPRNLAETLRYDEGEAHLQHRTLRAGAVRAALFHGHGGEVDAAKQNLLPYCREVDKGITDLLKDQRAPLVLAAVDYLQAIYREASTYRNLLEEGIAGNPDERSPEELHEAATRLLEPRFRKAREEAMERCMALAEAGRSSTDLREAAPAAWHGRVDFAFVPLGVQRWGTFNPETNETHVREKPEPGDEDLLNFVAMHAILNGGSVYAVPPSQMPNGACVAAAFRY